MTEASQLNRKLQNEVLPLSIRFPCLPSHVYKRRDDGFLVWAYG